MSQTHAAITLHFLAKCSTHVMHVVRYYISMICSFTMEFHFDLYNYWSDCLIIFLAIENRILVSVHTLPRALQCYNMPEGPKMPMNTRQMATVCVHVHAQQYTHSQLVINNFQGSELRNNMWVRSKSVRPFHQNVVRKLGQAM